MQIRIREQDDVAVLDLSQTTGRESKPFKTLRTVRRQKDRLHLRES